MSETPLWVIELPNSIVLMVLAEDVFFAFILLVWNGHSSFSHPQKASFKLTVTEIVSNLNILNKFTVEDYCN